MENTNPEVVTALKARIVTAEEELDEVYDEIDSREIFGKVNVLYIRGCIPKCIHLFVII